MREIDVGIVTEQVARMFVDANTRLGEDVVSSLENCLASEASPTGRDLLDQLLENAGLARATGVPLCQDTGLALVFLEVGQDLHLTGGDLREAVQAGVRKACKEGYLRASVVSPPLGRRVNTGDNTPAVIHETTVPGDRLRISVAPKGGGSENVSVLRMLRPADGRDGVKRFVVETVAKAGSNPCPPIAWRYKIMNIAINGFGRIGRAAFKALLEKRSNFEIVAINDY